MPDAIYRFPEDFLWGTATSSHQVEGGNTNNNWFAWENEPGRIVDMARKVDWPVIGGAAAGKRTCRTRLMMDKTHTACLLNGAAYNPHSTAGMMKLWSTIAKSSKAC